MTYHVCQGLKIDLPYLKYYARQALSIEYPHSIDSKAKTS